MWLYKQYENKYILSIKNHAEIVKSIINFCNECNIKAGIISGIGAVNGAILRFFNPETKKYVDKTFSGQMEISNLTGNISTMDGKLYVHIHITVSGDDYKAYAGHLLSAEINGAGEFIIESFDVNLERTYCPEIGINLYDFTK